MKIRKARPNTAVRLRMNRSKMIRPWLRRFCTSSTVSSRKGSTSSGAAVAWLRLICSNMSIWFSSQKEVDVTLPEALRVPDTGVHDPIEDICDQVEHDHKQSANRQNGEQDRIITRFES